MVRTTEGFPTVLGNKSVAHSSEAGCKKLVLLSNYELCMCGWGVGGVEVSHKMDRRCLL